MNEIYVQFALLLLHLIQVINCQDWHFQGPNVALRKDATHLPGTYGQNFTADLAVDGNTGAHLLNATRPQCTHTGADRKNQGASWTVDLGQPFIIKGIRIYNRKENSNHKTDYVDRLENFTVTGIPDTGAAIPLYDDRTPQIKMYEKTVINIIVNSKTPFSRIRVAIPARTNEISYLTLCEVEIYAVVCRFQGVSAQLQTQLVPDTGSLINLRTGATLKRYNSNLIKENGVTPGTQVLFECDQDAHFKLEGSHTLTCRNNGGYNDEFPHCEKMRSCPKLDPFFNGSYESQKADYYPIEFVKWTCNTGFSPQGTQMMFCTQLRTSGSTTSIWSSVSSCKQITCPYPGKLENGYNYKYTEGTAPVDTSVTVLCLEDYKPSVQSIRCTNNSTWSTPQPSCVRTTCPYPGPLENGNYTDIHGQSYIDGNAAVSTSFTVNCSTGYKPSIQSIQCIQSNHVVRWDNTANCIQITCRALNEDDGKLNGGKYIYSTNATLQRYIFGTFATAICLSKFKFNGEDKSRICGVSETWTGTTGACVPICPAPEPPPHGTFIDMNGTDSMGSYNVGDSVQLKCEDGYEENSGVQSSANAGIKCNDNHEWDIETLSCTAVKCLLYSLKNDSNHYQINPYPGDVIEYNQEVYTSCIHGYTQTSGNQNRSCQADGTLTGIELHCSQILDESSKTAENTGDSSNNTTAIGAGTGAVALVVAVAVVIIIVMRKRRTIQKTNKQDRMHRYQKSKPNADEANVYNEISDMEDGVTSRVKSAVMPVRGDDSREYYSFTNPIKMPDRGIKLVDLSDFVLSSSQHHDKYTAEFKSFPEGMVKPHKAALKNKDKNRYRNLYAYDETRVVLEVSNPKTETDYINANYVHGFNSPRAYIASQGTTKDNLDDFWRMIWQTGSGKIVMLTNVWEEGRVKCLEYWPVEEDTKTYGSITVTLANTEVFSNFTIRTLVVKKENENERHVQQFHFTAWPDRGVPTYCSALVHFRSKVKHAPTTCKGPTIVHCSAGIGRTGTYIALDYLTDQGRELGMVDVAGCVETLRRQRVNMVQTKEQYVFIHQALVETLMLSTSALPTEKFPETYRDLLTVDPNKGKQKLDLEFKMIGNMSPAPEEKQYSTAKEVKHREKNRYSNILPLDDYMPSIYEPGLSTNGGYINAAFLPSYKDANALIITQSPLVTTAEDFWKMVFHQQVHTIVMMNSRTELKDSEVYWPPTDEKVTMGDIEVTGKRSEKKVGHTVLTLTIKFGVMERTIRLLQFGLWKNGAQVPEEPKHILTALELVQDWQRRTGNHTVVVHCMDGTERSGLFCVLYALMERTKIEHDVAIAQIIQEMRNRREQIIPNLAQFKFCHEVVLEFLRQFDTYSNFSSI